LADLEVDFNASIASMNQEEANAVALVPKNQSLGQGMMIGGGIGALLGTYLIVDGANGC